MRFKAKRVLITGGATGIGHATAERFAAEGAEVHVLDTEKGSYSSPNIYPILCDVSNLTKVLNAVAQIQEQGPIHIAFANAGIYHLGDIENTSEADVDRVLNINLKGVLFLLKAVLPAMRKQRHGSIVLMGSDQTFVGKGHSSVYGATKGAIGQLTKSTAIDYAPFGIRVNCVCPGTIDTPLAQKVFAQIAENSPVKEEDFYSEQLIQRLGKPNEIANVVAFLCSNEASFMTGALVPVDAGYTAR